MHMTMQQIRELAGAYLRQDLLNDRQVEWKRHMAECDFCYEKFCAEYLILKELTENGLITEECLTEEPTDKARPVLLQMKVLGNQLIVECMEKASELLQWQFMPMPQLAVSRGENALETEACYISRQSEYSRITKTKDKLVIQLDGDVFQTEQLEAVVWTKTGQEHYPFVYNEETECYCIVLEKDALGEADLIEIVEKECDESDGT